MFYQISKMQPLFRKSQFQTFVYWPTRTNMKEQSKQDIRLQYNAD